MNVASAGRLRNSLTAAALFLATAAFTLWQNTRVCALWDISYLLDSSFRFALGQVPYRDFPFAHAPGTFLLHAALIRIFGRIYPPHIACAALESGAATLLTWHILLRIFKTKKDAVILGGAKHCPESPSLSLGNLALPWFLATILAVPLIFLGIYGVYPHPIYDSDAILAVLFALWLLLRASDRPLPNALAGAACILPTLFKQNIGLPFLFATAVIAAGIALRRIRQHQSIAPQLWLLAGATAATVLTLLALQLTVGLHNYVYWTMTFARQVRQPPLAEMLSTYQHTWLLWTLPTSIAGLILLRPGAPFMARPRRDMSGVMRPLSILLLLAAPFLWTIAALAISSDPSDRADQLLSLWPHLLILSAALALCNLRPGTVSLLSLLPLLLLVTVHGTFMSQQLWGSTYAIWPLLMLLIAAMLTQVPTVARPLAIVIAATFLLCGGLYAVSLERLGYIHTEGPEAHATLPSLHGLTTPGPWVPDFEELVRFTDAEIPATDSILLIPGETPFYFATGRTPQFPILLFAIATDPYTPQQTLDQARAHNIRWLIVSRNLQQTGPPRDDLPDVLSTLMQDYAPYRTLTNYDIYRHK